MLIELLLDSLQFRNDSPAVSTSSLRFDTSIVVPLRSSSCPSPDLALARPFPSAFTTLDFVQKPPEGGLEPAPASRFRGAYPRQLGSCARRSRRLAHTSCARQGEHSPTNTYLTQ